MSLGRWMRWECVSPADLREACERRTVVEHYSDPNWVKFCKTIPENGQLTVKLDGSDPEMRQETVQMILLYGWLLPDMATGRVLVRADDVRAVRTVQFRGGDMSFCVIDLGASLTGHCQDHPSSILCPVSVGWFTHMAGLKCKLVTASIDCIFPELSIREHERL